MLPEKWLFIGNPGTGKSTLLNCLAGSLAFESGLSFGVGLTKSSQTYTARDGIVYMDTPGLTDRSSEATAAAAITDALRSGGGCFKLCFVVRLENGRVVTEDLVTVERVLDSIRLNNVPFAFIVNNVGPTVYKKLSVHQSEFQRVVTLFNSGRYTTPHFLFVPRIDALELADNRRIDLPEGIRASIERFPMVDIPPHVVSEIWTGSTLEIERLKHKMQTVWADGAALQDAQADLAQRHQDFWAIALTAAPMVLQIVGLLLA